MRYGFQGKPKEKKEKRKRKNSCKTKTEDTIKEYKIIVNFAPIKIGLEINPILHILVEKRHQVFLLS